MNYLGSIVLSDGSVGLVRDDLEDGIAVDCPDTSKLSSVGEFLSTPSIPQPEPTAWVSIS